MSDIYLSITETPTVVTLTNPLISSNVAQSVTVTNVVSVNVVTMPAITVQAAAPAVTTVAGTVSISNFPSTQTIAGTVTANLDADSFVAAIIENNANGEQIFVQVGNVNGAINSSNPLAISGTVTVGNSVTIGSLPAISGTVTASVAMFTTVTVQTITGGQNGSGISFLNNFGLYDVTFVAPGEYTIQSGFISGENFIANGVTIPLTTSFGSSVSGNFHIGSLFRRPTPYSNSNNAFRITAVTTGMNPASFTATIRAISDPYYGLDRPISGTVTARLQDASGNNLTSTSIGGVQRLNVSLASAATSGGSIPSFVNVYGGSDGSAVRTISVDSTGRQNTNPQFPRVTFIDGSGTVTTANTAITVFASSSTRSYLLVQVTTGSAFVNVGATATTVNGINLTAGQGYAWENTIPQGIVSLISTTTSSRWVAKEA